MFGTYNGVNLVNKRGNTGTGATADIVITDVLDTASHVSADRFGDARVLINNNASIIADIAVGLMNRFGTPVANRFADAATLITGNTNLIANERRAHDADIPLRFKAADTLSYTYLSKQTTSGKESSFI